MAKKSSKSMKGFLFDFLVLVLAGGLLGFLALPFMKYQTTALGSTAVTNYSGYGLLNFDANAGIATVILLLVIFASLLTLFAIVKMLADLGLFKNKSISKILAYVVVFLAFAALVLTITNMIYIPTQCNSGSIGSYFSTGTQAAWLGLIISAVDALFAFVASLFTLKK